MEWSSHPLTLEPKWLHQETWSRMPAVLRSGLEPIPPEPLRVPVRPYQPPVQQGFRLVGRQERLAPTSTVPWSGLWQWLVLLRWSL